MANRYHLPANLLAFLLALLSGTWARAQAPVAAPSWTQAIAVTQSASSANSSSVAATASDANGNIYVAGTFRGTVSIGAFTVTSIGSENAFVAKWDPVSSNFIWVETAAATSSVSSLAVSGTSVYVAGYFYGGTATFGSTALTNADPNANTITSSDVFVAKLTDAGATAGFVWAQRAGGVGNDYLGGLTSSGSNVYLTGSFEGPTSTFGGTTLTKTAPATNNSTDAFVAKLTDAGSTSSFSWAQSFGGQGNDYCRAIGVNGPNVYITGGFNSSVATFGSISLTNNTFNYSTYVTKLVDAGSSASVTWAQRVSDGTGDYMSSLVVTGSSIYLAGGFSGPTTQIGSTLLTNVGSAFSFDVFVAKCTDTGVAGQFEWALRGGGNNSDEIVKLAVTGADLYVVGNFTSATIDFGPLTLANNANNGFPDLFVVKISGAGPSPVFVWAQQAGGPQNDQAQTATLSGSTLYVAGFVYTPAYFGSLSFVFPTNSAVPFLAALAESSPLASTAATPLAGLLLAPNPAHTAAMVYVPPVPGARQAILTLLDALGRVVRVQPLALLATGTNATLPVAGLAPGLYRLQVAVSGQRISRVLAVE